MKLNLATIRKHVNDEASAYFLLEKLRWPNGPICPHCDNEKAYFLTPKNGTSRKTNRGTSSQRRVWKCAACRKQFSVITGTVMHGTKIPIETWLMVMVQMCSAKNGISAREVERMHDLTPESAWYMLHRLREAMKRDPLASLLSGTIVADETWIGGDPTRMNRQTRARWEAPIKVTAGSRGNSLTTKTPVLSLVNVETGEVRSRVVADVSGHTLRKAIADQVNMAESHLQTDSSKSYLAIGREFQSHQSVNHFQGEYVRDGVSTNKAEGFFSQLKRSLDGTHHHVSHEHLHRYVAEFDFKYSTCKMDDSERLQMMVDQTAGRRLSYKPLLGGL